MLRIVSACVALIAGFAVSSALAQSYPPDDDNGGGGYGAAPAPSHSDDYGTPDSSHDGYGSSESAPVDIAPPDEAPAEDGSGEDTPPPEDGH
jgi:hypothetical protein